MRYFVFFFILISLFSCVPSRNIPYGSSQPEKDFDIFWTTFRDHYAFFKLKGVNWDSSYVQYRPKVSAKTNRAELVALLGQMADPLKDGHITISAGDEVLYKGKKPSLFRETFKGKEKTFWAIADNLLLQHSFAAPVGIGPLFKGEPLIYASHNNNAAYIRITRFFGDVESLFDDRKERADLHLMCTLWDSLLQAYAAKSSLIIDLRGNGGGHGGIELAGSFTNKKLLTHYKAIRVAGGYENMTPLQAQYLEPANGIQFLKPIVLLTSDRTASSAEDFVISLYQLPQVTTIGTPTSGMLSDMYSANLSNGLSFTLSNQRYYSTDTSLMEDSGVPPKIKLANTLNDFEQKTDPVLLKALSFLP